MTLALSNRALFISLMQLVNGTQFLNTTWISIFPPPADTHATVIVPLTIIHASL